MSKRCDLTGVGPKSGMNVSHSNRHTKRRWEPNIKKKRIFIPEENRWITVRISTTALKTLTKKGMASVEKIRARVLRQNPSFRHA
jgi:large subunit ribosomal protein L28